MMVIMLVFDNIYISSLIINIIILHLSLSEKIIVATLFAFIQSQTYF